MWKLPLISSIVQLKVQEFCGKQVDLYGVVLETVLAPEGGGMLLVLRSKPRVDPGELVAAVVAH